MNTIGMYDNRPMDPPDNEPEIFSECIVDGSWGIYVPQRFCQNYEKTSGVSQEDWDICLAGPDHELYWEAWDEILSNWGGEETDAMGNVFRVYIEQESDLFQHREFVRCEYTKADFERGIDF
jgi:hypothetical protein